MGYGHYYYPRTIMGRIVAFFICLWGLCILSLMVVTLTSILNLSHSESKVYTILDRVAKRKQVRIIASKFIASTLKYRLFLRKFRNNYYSQKLQKRKRKLSQDLMKNLTNFKILSQ